MMKRYFIMLAAVVAVPALSAQADKKGGNGKVHPQWKHPATTKRVQPQEWKKLVHGGQFMDRILPAPIYRELTTDTWGADTVKPRDIQNGIEDPGWSYWGGKPVLGPDNKYHWFGCRWPEDNPKGHLAWRRSVMVRAVSDRPTGPFIVEEEIAPGHFPEITQLKDGRWALFHLEGYYLSDTIFGPWTHVTQEEAGFPGIHMGSVCLREDGSLLMVDRSSRLWIKENDAEPFVRMTEHRVIPEHMPGKYEDPVVWRTEVQYHMIVNDWMGRIAYHMRSEDGIHWKTDPGKAYTVDVDSYEDGTKVGWFKYERPKVLQDQYGRATHVYFAVIDVTKRDDLSSDNHSSKNIALPLVVERRLQMLNTTRITGDTSEIRVKVLAEDGFDPHTDMEIESLRFGATEEVDYGRGSSVLRTEKTGKDLILVFDGKGNGITDGNFAGKLLGKTNEGKLLLGYTRLPEQ